MGKNIDEIDKNVPYKELEPIADAEANLKTKKKMKIRQEFTANVSHELKHHYINFRLRRNDR